MKTLLKPIAALLLFAAVLTTAACGGKDDDKESSEPAVEVTVENILGTWETVSAETVMQVADMPELSETETDVFDKDNYSRLTFNADGTFSIFSHMFDEEEEEEPFENTATGLWTLRGTELVLTPDDPEDFEMEELSNVTVKTLTAHTMVLYTEMHTVLDDEDMEGAFEVDVKATMRFKRI